jgi:hypothetical protein
VIPDVSVVVGVVVVGVVVAARVHHPAKGGSVGLRKQNGAQSVGFSRVVGT